MQNMKEMDKAYIVQDYYSIADQNLVRKKIFHKILIKMEMFY